MTTGEGSLPQLEPVDHCEASRRTGGAAGQPQEGADPESQNLALLATVASVLAYAGSLAWVSWANLLQLLTNPVPQGVAIFAMTLQVMVPLLAVLSYAVIHLSCRRGGDWFLTAEAMCMLGVIAAAIGTFARAIA